MKLPTIAKRHERRTDDELRAALETGRDELRGFQRAHQRFRDVAHRAADESIADAGSELNRLLARYGLQAKLQAAGPPGQESLIDRLGALHATQDPAFAARWHAAIETAEAGTFSTMTSLEFKTEERKRVAAIAELEAELKRRVIAERQAVDERELAELEASVP